MKKHRNNFRRLVWIGIIACLLWSGAAHAQSQTITSTGTIGDSSSFLTWTKTNSIPLTITFDPAGGPVTGSAVYHQDRTELSGVTVQSVPAVCASTLTITMNGTFEGGDGGDASGTILYSFSIDDPNDPGYWMWNGGPGSCTSNVGFFGKWSGNFDADGSGYGTLQLDTEGNPVFPWEVTYSPFESETPELTPAGPACTPSAHGLSPSKPGDVISPGATFTGPDGSGVGIIQERWFLNGVNTTSIVWDGKVVNVELQYTCLDNSMGSRNYTIPAYQALPEGQPPVQPGEEPPSFPGNLTPQDIATGVGAILIGLGGIIGIGGAIVVGGAIIGAAPTPPIAQSPPPGSPQPGSPGAPGGGPPPQASPGGDAPKSFVDSPIWDLVKTNTSAASTITGTMSDLLKFPDSADKVQKMRDALDAWRSNPTPANADIYRKTLDNSFKGKYPGIGKVSDALGNLSKGVDIMDAIGAGMKKAAEKGLGGDDQTLIIIGEVGKEIIKKGLTWTITKNPVVGVVDAVVGGVTQGVLGKDNRIDLGAGVDKVAGGVFNVYDKTTSGLGRLWEKGLTDAAKADTKSALENARRHINDQVSRGKISDTTGRSRLRRLEKSITGED